MEIGLSLNMSRWVVMSRKTVKNRSIKEQLKDALIPLEDEPYRVPENWIWVKLKSINNTKKRNLQPNKYPDEVFELYSVPSFETDEPEYLEGKEIKSGKQIVKQDEVLLCKINPRINRVWIVNEESNYRQLASTEWIVISKSKVILPKYILYLLRSPYFRKMLVSNVSGVGGSLTRARPKEVESYPITIPPLNEQKRIVDKIERLLNKIDEAKQLIDEAKEPFELRREAILDKAFRGELTAKWRKENNIKFSMEIKRLEELIETGPQNGLYKPQSAYGEGTLIVRIDNFYNGWVNEWETLKRLKLDEREKSLYGLNNNDLLINRVNSIEYLGKSALVRNLPEPCVFESNVMRIKLNELVDPEYLILYLNSSKGLQELRKNAKHAVNQASINQQDVKNTLVPLPIMEEQIEIVRAVSSILYKEKNVINNISSQERNLNIMKASILSKAFCGELGTNDPTEESATDLLKELLQGQKK